jgi:hypothetical protein
LLGDAGGDESLNLIVGMAQVSQHRASVLPPPRGDRGALLLAPLDLNGLLTGSSAGRVQLATGTHLAAIVIYLLFGRIDGQLQARNHRRLGSAIKNRAASHRRPLADFARRCCAYEAIQRMKAV